MTADMESLLASLRASVADATGPDIVRRLIHPDSSTDLYLAVQAPGGHAGILLRRPKGCVPPANLLTEGQGFVLSAGALPEEPGKSGCLSLFCTDRTYDAIFLVFARDVIDKVLAAETPDQALAIFLARVALWERFFRMGSESTLSIDAQAGLFAELLVLRDLIMPIVGAAAALAGWRGPKGSAQDFVLGDIALEVKSSRAKSTERLHIASELQLDDRPFRNLGVALVLLSDGGTQCEGLNDLVRSVATAVAGDLKLTKLFFEKLLEVGWIEAHAARYEATRYFVRGKAYFRVAQGFPRIIPGDFPSGVGGIRYTVDVSSLERFAVEEGSVQSWLR